MSSIELGELNLRQGKHAVAFDIFFELAQFELSLVGEVPPLFL